MTGYGQDADKERSKNAGFNFHLVKPIHPERLQELLASLTPS
jgi:CheY-like chemotaxis protein